MKKWFIAAGVIFILTISLIYILIPEKIIVSKVNINSVTISGQIRQLSSEENWEKWWHEKDGKPHIKGAPFTYNGVSFHLIDHQTNLVGIQMKYHGLKLNSFLQMVSLNNDTSVSSWQCEIQGGNNPFSRIANYRTAIEIKKNMDGVMQNLSDYYSNPKNIYGLDIHRSSTVDTLLLSKRFTSTQMPTTNEIYKHLAILQENIKKQKAIITGFPMLNISKSGTGSYETQVAYPTNIWLKDSGDLFSRRMVKGYFMVTELTGGPYTVNQAIKQLEYYMTDYNKITMAIPFQYLITNRLAEKDSSKWITRICMPTME